MKLYIIRHAESQGNATGEYGTEVSDSLSPQGEKQAEALTDELKSLCFDRIIVSPRLRAMQTIMPYLKNTQQIGEIWPELAEACWHEEREEPAESWNPTPVELTDSEKEIFTFRDNESVIPAHPETFSQALCRVNKAFERIQKMAAESDESILMVSHGHFIREFINIILDTRKIVDFHKVNCGITLFTFDGEWTMQFCNRQIEFIKMQNQS